MELDRVWASGAALAGRRLRLAGPELARPEAALVGAHRTKVHAVVAVSA